MKDGLPDLDDIRKAQDYLRGKANRTELVHSTTFSSMFGGDIFFKMENHQKTGSFKTRGALYRTSQLSEDERRRGVITASSGNHAQGVAYAARFNGISAKIVMPEHTIPAKVNAVQEYGAEVVLYGSDYTESKAMADEISLKEGRVFIEAFNDPYIISGQGTVGLEIMEDAPDIDIVVVPVGGGGLISGIAAAVKGINPDVKVIGVESELSDSMKMSVEAGRIVPHTSGQTIAEGISVKYPGEMTLAAVTKYVDEIVTVSDETIALAIYRLLERNKTLVEPSGAAATAALMEGKIEVAGKKAAVILSGGNMNFLLLSRIIYKAMQTESKLVRIELKIRDRPGELLKVASAVSSVGSSIYHLEVDNLSLDTPVGFQSVIFSVNVRGREHLSDLLEKIRGLGCSYRVVT